MTSGAGTQFVTEMNEIIRFFFLKKKKENNSLKIIFM
jgi:hypothetical protein